MSGFFTHFQRLLSTLVSAVLLISTHANAATLVNCYDQKREMVTRTHPDNCQGQTVGDDEANAIRDRRRAYVQQSIDADKNPIIVGKRLMSIGAGFFVNSEGTLLTNAHVVKNCETLIVSRAGGELLPAHLIAIEPKIDLALVSTDFHPNQIAVFAPLDAPLPTSVAIIGYPNQGLPPIRPLLTQGIIMPSKLELTSATPRPISIQADVRPGNSGGPVLDEFGRVIGVIFAAVDTPAVYKNTGRIVRDIGIAIPNRFSFEFLERNAITPTIMKKITEKTSKQEQILDEAGLFVARVECWRKN
ncbi:MAG: trypsin-like peptidase domain-containing protein [Chromatium okenii]|nr:trypsin-like peptidase domain-containing protein [Chromatium okenii]